MNLVRVAGHSGIVTFVGITKFAGLANLLCVASRSIIANLFGFVEDGVANFFGIATISAITNLLSFARVHFKNLSTG